MGMLESGGLTKIRCRFPLPHLTGNIERSCSARLAGAVLVVTGRPDHLGLYAQGLGDPLLSFRETANKGDRQAAGVFEAVFKRELGKGVTRLFECSHDIGWVPVF